ncbi:aldo/keto reductase [Corynebacterium urogenitale]
MVGMAPYENIAMNDGNSIPQLGLGVWELSDEDTYSSVRAAIEVGCRHVDTAKIYGNEEAVGRAIADAISAGEIAREDIFVTTKLWNEDQTRGEEALNASLQRLGMDYVDLYLLHWPCPKAGTYVQAYESMIAGQEAGKVRSVGVCNFYQETLEDLTEKTGHTPAINQIEIHPGFSQVVQRSDNAAKGIVTESWSPLGKGTNLTDPRIAKIAANHGVSPAQAIIRWHIQRGDVVIPRSSKVERVKQNFDVFGFSLSAEDMAAIDVMDVPDGRVGPDPLEFHVGTPADS